MLICSAYLDQLGYFLVFHSLMHGICDADLVRQWVIGKFLAKV